MGKRALGVLATVAAVAGVLGSAPTASAVEAPAGCGSGDFCIYSGEYSTGQLVLKSGGNWSGRVTGRSIFNNGTPFPGYDHIQVNFEIDGRADTTCLHYNPGPGDFGLNSFHPLVFTKVTWRGEC